MLFLSLALAGAAIAHTGVKNPAVMARMDAMRGVADKMKIFGQMAEQETEFDATAARAAAAAIAQYAKETPSLFKERENDPKSEAKRAIWENFPDFTAKSQTMERVAVAIAGSISTPDDLHRALKELGDTCLSCHKTYREQQ